jgi:hypothetical protein
MATYSGFNNVLVGGTHTFRLPGAEIHELFKRVNAARFCLLKEKYFGADDDQAAELTLIDDKIKKTVVDYGGRFASMPNSVSELEAYIDKIGADRYVFGDASTFPTLTAERFDFHSKKSANLLGYVTYRLIAEDAPLPVGTLAPVPDNGPVQVTDTTRPGRITLVRDLIAAGALSSASPRQLAASLNYALILGDPDMVAKILKSNSKSKLPFPGINVALNSLRRKDRAIQLDKQKILTIERLLLGAGGNQNGKLTFGQSVPFSLGPPSRTLWQ